MRQNSSHLQEQIDNFLGRKTTQYPDIEEYARDVYRLEANGR